MNDQAAAALVAARSAGRCEGCRCHAGESFQHRRKSGQGGLWLPSNGVRLCGHGTAGCHGDIEANPQLGYDLGIGLESWQDPVLEPAYLHTVNGTGWWLLDDEGCMTWVDPQDIDPERCHAATRWDRRPSHRASMPSFPSNPSLRGR